MSAPTSRAQRILQFIAGSKGAVTLAEIAAAVAKNEPQVESYKHFALHVSAQLSQMHEAKKVMRTGTRGAYRYVATPSVFVDRRKQPEPPAKVAKPAPSPQPSKVARPTAPKKASREVFANLRPAAPRRPGERETVAEFEARGGRIQKLAHGESSQPAYQSVRDVDQRSMRTRLQKALDTDPANTTDDKAVAA